MACSRNWTPVIPGMRWSTRSRATGSSATRSSRSASMASSPELARMMRYCSPYLLRRSRATACRTSRSSSTARITGLAISVLQLASGKRPNHIDWSALLPFQPRKTIMVYDMSEAHSEADHTHLDGRLIESEARYRAVIENASDMVQSCRPDGSFEFVNPAWLQKMGYT